MDKVLFEKWRKYIPDLGEALRRMEEKNIIAVGVAPYPRIIPSVFLDHYLIYSVKDAADIDDLKKYAKILCLEEKNPKLANKVQATGYLLNNYAFQGFLKAQRYPFRLMFYQTTKKIVETLERLQLPWIGNRPESFENVVLKGDFRDLVKKLSLPSIPDWRLSRDEFLGKSFQELWDHWGRTPVVQRADFDVAGEMGTFFLKTEADWQLCHEMLSKDTRYTTVTISPFITGNSLSMLGCITRQGVLSSTLQLQLIDVPESLHGQPATGVFLGHDWGFQDWPESVERTAQDVVETVGRHLATQGFKGIFGIDFIYDTTTKEIFPIECNPRFTGALPIYSLMVIANEVPPMEFFHILTHLNLDIPFDFESVNRGLKKRRPVAHISLTPKGAYQMKFSLPAGIYSYDPVTMDIQFQRPGAFLSDFKKDNEFMLIDSLPRIGGRIIQNVPRLCKLIFPRTIAHSSFEIDKEVGRLITALSTALRKNQVRPDSEEAVSGGSEEA